jgi:uncharacterized membrane protein
MTEEKYKERYYQKQKYEAAIGSFAVATVFIFVGILALIFLRFGIGFIGLQYWGYYMFIPAFFILLGAFNQVYTNSKYKKAVLRAITDRQNQGTYKLEHIALEVGIKPKNLLRVLADLRQKGKIMYRFNADTGEIELGQTIQYVRSEEYISPAKKLQTPVIVSEPKNFCVYCGYAIDRAAKFCPSCGSKLS